ncbi:aminotransferase class V-fold PLP-dependent enzyme [Garciella nitratireducens]|uniref:Selenocysteine lyase/Cysteine desulfurase n=1 Tax=Garciella nitratireducens DSM 15102 TaxID=1121911 RepID=A0A1T4KKH5_9FIRM|nr:aminotransferase class V-fold PLP-dependent enzyme [Garciella nitratireducens]SJZ42895.1 Selenocysteine lyase/Cysteine desulfurase [Garciella nitratireducens DSM 15102]
MFFKKKYTIKNIPKYIIGNRSKIPIINQKMLESINFDNAASTPILQPVLEYIQDYLPWYSSVHRGTGFKSQLSTELYDFCHEQVLNFFQGDFKKDIVIFTKNTTEAINKLSYRLSLQEDDIVLTSIMEHHSNDLPWRKKCHVEYMQLNKQGTLDLNHIENLIKKYGKKIKLITFTGASNVTGLINPIYEIAQLAHAHGIPIMVDGAQLAPHRNINMLPHDDPRHIDYLALSAHKMYAPLGGGGLIGPKKTFKRGDPEYSGGGTIKSVTLQNIYWADPPDKEEAGSPNTIGAIALKKSMDILKEIGINSIAHHEFELTHYLISKLKKYPEIILYENIDSLSIDTKVGVVPFNIKGLNHALVAAILSYEYGISVRNGCFCAHPYIHHLLKLSPQQIYMQQKQILQSNYYHVVGMIRISFGMYNQIEEIKHFLTAIEEIIQYSKKDYYQKRYYLDRKTGAYYPKNYSIDFQKYFLFNS